MKVKVLSLLVPALLVAGAANAAEVYNKDGNKLDLYGKVDGLHYFSDNKSEDGDQTYMRLGFKGETQVTDQLTGYGQWEYQIQGNSAENENNSWTRVAFAGLKFQDVGSFDYGRNYGVVYDVTSCTDVLPEFGGDTATAITSCSSVVGGVATYRNSNFFGLVDGLNFAVQYLGKNERAVFLTISVVQRRRCRWLYHLRIRRLWYVGAYGASRPYRRPESRIRSG